MTGPSIVLLKREDCSEGLRATIGGSKDLGYWIVYRGAPLQVLDMLHQAVAFAGTELPLEDAIEGWFLPPGATKRHYTRAIDGRSLCGRHNRHSPLTGQAAPLQASEPGDCCSVCRRKAMTRPRVPRAGGEMAPDRRRRPLTPAERRAIVRDMSANRGGVR